jgi:hypothetical protein
MEEMAMKYGDFKDSLSSSEPGAGIDGVLLALWYEKNEDWDRAHEIVQAIPSEIGSAVHAYLHRKEGDIGNARYWYGRAGRDEFLAPLDDEWDALAREIAAD